MLLKSLKLLIILSEEIVLVFHLLININKQHILYNILISITYISLLKIF